MIKFHLLYLKETKLPAAGVNILPNEWIRYPGTIINFLGLWVELLLARSADSNSAQRPKIMYFYNDVTTSNSTQKFLTKYFLCDEFIEFGKKIPPDVNIPLSKGRISLADGKTTIILPFLMR